MRAMTQRNQADVILYLCVSLAVRPSFEVKNLIALWCRSTTFKTGVTISLRVFHPCKRSKISLVPV